MCCHVSLAPWCQSDVFVSWCECHDLFMTELPLALKLNTQGLVHIAIRLSAPLIEMTPPTPTPSSPTPTVPAGSPSASVQNKTQTPPRPQSALLSSLPNIKVLSVDDEQPTGQAAVPPLATAVATRGVWTIEGRSCDFPRFA